MFEGGVPDDRLLNSDGRYAPATDGSCDGSKAAPALHE
jgi:hypothetical protein